MKPGEVAKSDRVCPMALEDRRRQRAAFAIYRTWLKRELGQLELRSAVIELVAGRMSTDFALAVLASVDEATVDEAFDRHGP